MIRRHIEGPQVLLDVYPGCIHGHQERGNTPGVTRIPGGTGHHQIRIRGVYTGIPGFFAIDKPLVPVPHGFGFHMGGVGAVFRFGNAEGEAFAGIFHSFQPLGLLCLAAVFQQQQQADIVAHHGVLVLQIVVQPQSL